MAKGRRLGPKFLTSLAEWLDHLDLRFDCSAKDALDHCVNEEDAEWLRRVRANLAATMGSRDVVYEKKMEKILKRKLTEEDREIKAKAKWKDEKEVEMREGGEK